MVRDRQAGGGGEGGRVEGRELGRRVPSPGTGPQAPHRWHWELGPPLLWPQPLPHAAVGESSWHPVSSGIPDCYYNVTHLPVGITVRFRVACANRAGQGPFSGPSDKVLVRGMRGQWDRVGVSREGRGP